MFCQKILLRNVEFHLFGVFLQQAILILVGFLTYFFEVTNFSVSIKLGYFILRNYLP